MGSAADLRAALRALPGSGVDAESGDIMLPWDQAHAARAVCDAHQASSAGSNRFAAVTVAGDGRRVAVVLTPDPRMYATAVAVEVLALDAQTDGGFSALVDHYVQRDAHLPYPADMPATGLRNEIANNAQARALSGDFGSDITDDPVALALATFLGDGAAEYSGGILLQLASAAVCRPGLLFAARTFASDQVPAARYVNTPRRDGSEVSRGQS